MDGLIVRRIVDLWNDGLTRLSPYYTPTRQQQQEKRIEDAIKSIREQYEGVLEKKQEEYVEKYRHLQYIEVRMHAVVW